MVPGRRWRGACWIDEHAHDGGSQEDDQAPPAVPRALDADARAAASPHEVELGVSNGQFVEVSGSGLRAGLKAEIVPAP